MENMMKKPIKMSPEVYDLRNKVMLLMETGQELTVKEMADVIADPKYPEGNLNFHVRNMLDEGLLLRTKNGRQFKYRKNPDPTKPQFEYKVGDMGRFKTERRIRRPVGQNPRRAARLDALGIKPIVPPTDLHAAPVEVPVEAEQSPMTVQPTFSLRPVNAAPLVVHLGEGDHRFRLLVDGYVLDMSAAFARTLHRTLKGVYGD